MCPSPCPLTPTPPPLPRPPTPPLPQPSSTRAKRGVCVARGVNSTHCDDLRALSGVAGWYTNWEATDSTWGPAGRCAAQPDEPVVADVEFVPQVWSIRHIGQAAADAGFPPAGSKYLLAFNEPDKRGATSWTDPTEVGRDRMAIRPHAGLSQISRNAALAA